MCGRYTIEEDESVDLRALYEELRVSHPYASVKSGEIFPTDTVPLLCFGGERRPLCPAVGVWGFRKEGGGSGSSVVINARAESATERPMFRECFLRRRCVVPTAGYFEWNKDKVKHRFSVPDSPVTYLAGLWRPDPAGARFVVLTTAANSSVSPVHHRMPVILPPDALSDWVRNTDFAAYYLRQVMPSLACRPA